MGATKDHFSEASFTHTLGVFLEMFWKSSMRERAGESLSFLLTCMRLSNHLHYCGYLQVHVVLILTQEGASPAILSVF